MDSNQTFDNVKAEKANAIRRYRRHQILKWLFKACVALAPLFALSRSSTWLPVAAKFSGVVLRQLLNSHLFVFVLFNAIVLAIYVLSGAGGQNPTGNNNNNDSKTGHTRPDLYNEFVVNTESRRRIVTGVDSPATETTPVEKSFGDNSARIVCSENVASPLVHETETVTEMNGSVPPIRAITGYVERDDVGSPVEKQRYRRTQSGSFPRKKVNNSKSALKRSETEIHRKTASCGGEPARRSSAVDEMSDEEFNRQVEAFIATKKLIQREEFRKERRTEINGVALLSN